MNKDISKVHWMRFRKWLYLLVIFSFFPEVLPDVSTYLSVNIPCVRYSMLISKCSEFKTKAELYLGRVLCCSSDSVSVGFYKRALEERPGAVCSAAWLHRCRALHRLSRRSTHSTRTNLKGLNNYHNYHQLCSPPNYNDCNYHDDCCNSHNCYYTHHHQQ